MSTHDLNVTSREETGKQAAKRLRRAGRVPAIAYGHKEEPVKLALNARELRDLLAHGGTHSMLNLKFDGGSSPDLPVIIKQLQRHPVTHNVSAVDFLRVSRDEKVTVTVPLILEGEPTGVKIDGGILVQALHEIEIQAPAAEIPDHIVVDVSQLEFNGAPVHVKDLTLPRGVIALTSGEESIAVVNPPDAEPIVEEPVAAEAVAAEGEAEAEGEAAAE